MTALAVTYSEAQLVEYLGALAACAGSSKLASQRLAEKGIDMSRGELDVLREQHTPLYMALAEERSRAVEEGIAQSYREIVVGAQRVTKGFIDQLSDDIDAGKMPRDMERTVGAMAKVLQVSTDKLLSITGRPVAGQAQQDPMEALKELEKLGIARRVERPVADIDADAVEVDDGA